MWFDRQGNLLVATPEQPGGPSALALSSDGERAALVRQDSANPLNRDIWTWDTHADQQHSLTFTPPGRVACLVARREPCYLPLESRWSMESLSEALQRDEG